MYWLSLFVAGIFEIVWAVGLKLTDGFSKILPSVVTVAGIVASFFFLSIALKKLPLSIAYAIWTGIGTAGTVLFGIFYFHEPTDLAHIICVGLILCGIIGLRILS
ncbi:MAG: multidrug efflux SMR transporter [Selenomonadaceae bacterium]|nr:multidrug efflux SMR transporter [Selenomonadaceae bacterium]